jgi:hypothetical protein
MFAASKTASVTGGYQISRSLRFNSADSAYLNRTPASAGNRKQWSWSLWFKVASVGTEIHFFGASQNSCYLRTDSTLQFIFGATNYRITSQVFRDVGAWMHLVVVWDSSNATVADRLRIYINGVQVTAFSTNNAVTLNDDSGINSVTAHNIGRFYGGSDYFNGYITEVNFIDGQALTASSFGETNAQTGVWQPKAYSGSYGTNGFYLNFSDNSNTTAATLGKDYSGNGNNWTPNNFSVTAGAGNDSLVDSPTSYGVDTGVGGSVRGNYGTWNPLDRDTGSTYTTYANGNLDCTVTGTRAAVATLAITSGKWYWEVVPTGNTGSVNYQIGVADANTPITTRSYTGANGWTYFQSGSKFNNNSGASYGASYTTNDVIGVALDMDAGTVTFYKNGTSQGVAYSTLSGKAIQPMVSDGSSVHTMNYTGNFGQRPFAYTAPSGFKALCTQNLPTPTIGATTATQANKYFDVVLRNGGGSSGGTYSTTVNMANGAWLWDKPRSASSDHYLIDSVRGISKTSSSNTTGSEQTQATFYTGFNNGSYTTGSGDWGTGVTLVDWIWAANGSGSTNTSGSITSTISANTTSGFSVVTYTGNGTNGASVGHGLGVTPAMVIMKQRSVVGAWLVYHQSISSPSSNYLNLNSTDASAAASGWLTPSSSTLTFTTSYGSTNGSGVTMVAYCFAEVAGYSKFGSYTGNGSADGPFVFTGMRPAYVMIKQTNAAAPWIVFDAARNTANAEDNILYPNTSGAEDKGVGTSPLGVDFLSNGFKIRNADAWLNGTGSTYIFMAFATNPFKYSLAR